LFFITFSILSILGTLLALFLSGVQEVKDGFFRVKDGFFRVKDGFFRVKDGFKYDILFC
jgi:hypothetical protein